MRSTKTHFERQIMDMFGPDAIEAEYAVVGERTTRRPRLRIIPRRRTWTVWRTVWAVVLFLWLAFCGAIAGWLGPSLSR